MSKTETNLDIKLPKANCYVVKQINLTKRINFDIMIYCREKQY